MEDANNTSTKKEKLKEEASITKSQFKKMFDEYEYEQRARRSSHHIAEDVRAKWEKELFGETST